LTEGFECPCADFFGKKSIQRMEGFECPCADFFGKKVFREWIKRPGRFQE